MRPFLILTAILALIVGPLFAAEPLPDSLLSIAVRPTDLDQKGHVNNARYLEYLQCGRWDWLESRGLSNDAMEANENTTLVVANVNINYRRPIHYGDKVLVATGAKKKGDKSILFHQDIVVENNGSYADAEVTMVAVDLDTKRSRKLPKSLDKLLSAKGNADAPVATVGSPFHLVAADPKATTLHLDKAGTSVSVAREGAFVRLMLREATKDKTDPSGVVVLLSDSSVRLTRADAQRLADLLNQASEDGSEPSARAKAPWLHLTAAGANRSQWHVLPENGQVWGYGAVVLADQERNGSFLFAEFRGDYVYTYGGEGRKKVTWNEIAIYNNSLIQPPADRRASAGEGLAGFNSVFRLASQCGAGGCSVPRRPAAAVPRAPRQPAATGYSRPRFARRVLGRVGRVFGRCGGCCR